MPSDPNVMPKMKELVPSPAQALKIAYRGVGKALHFLFDRVYGDQPALFMSEHYRPDTGAEAVLAGEQQMIEHWGDMATPLSKVSKPVPDVAGRDIVIEKPDAGQMRLNWTNRSDYPRRD